MKSLIADFVQFSGAIAKFLYSGKETGQIFSFRKILSQFLVVIMEYGKW